MNVIHLLGSGFGLAFLSGLNLYATILTVGLGTQLGIIELPKEVGGLAVLGNPIILIFAGALYAIEFFADKIPWVDNAWDAIHTVIRPLGAAIIGIMAITGIEPVFEVLIFMIMGGIGLSSHSSKAGSRLIINQSPEPLSNTSVSLFEDIFVFSGSMFVIKHPVISFFIVIIFLILTAIFLPKLIRLIRLEITAFVSMIVNIMVSMKLIKPKSPSQSLPISFNNGILNQYTRSNDDIFIRCFTGKNVSYGKNYRGYICMIGNDIFFLIKKRFKIRQYIPNWSDLAYCEFKKGLFLDSMDLHYETKIEQFRIPKGQAETISPIIEFVKSQKQVFDQ